MPRSSCGIAIAVIVTVTAIVSINSISVNALLGAAIDEGFTVVTA
jgi:hypothetical protein